MREKKRFVLKLFIILLAISFSVVAVIVLSKIIFGELQNEQEMMSNYETKKEKCELLKDIAKESIQEGVGIDTRKIPNDEVQYGVQYRIYNDNENIIFYYSLQDDSTNEHDLYNARITLSNEYKILEEEYSIEIESLDEYIESYNLESRYISVTLSIILVLCFYLLIVILIIIIIFLLEICIMIKKKKLLVGDKDTMRFFGERYLIQGWGDSEYVITAKALHKQVMKDCKSYYDYNWIAPARELVRICKKTGFPSDYALDIKIAILNCFANIEQDNCGGTYYINLNSADKEAVQYCYNSLYGIDNKEAIMARRRYLTEIIHNISFFYLEDFYPDTFRKLREDWCKSKFEEYFSKENIDFEQLGETLHNDFEQIIKKAESNGEFEEDKKS